VTDLLVLRGVFSRLSLCVYGEEGEGKLWEEEAGIQEAVKAGAET
jgi:hypothetical protein